VGKRKKPSFLKGGWGGFKKIVPKQFSTIFFEIEVYPKREQVKATWLLPVKQHYRDVMSA